MEYTHEYDQNYNGPALPVIELQVSALVENGLVITRSGLVDSGADATLIPLRDLKEISARQVDRKRIRGIGGISYPVDIYEVSISIGPFSVPKVYAIANNQTNEVVIGRDILNQFTTTLNGQAYMVHISQ